MLLVRCVCCIQTEWFGLWFGVLVYVTDQLVLVWFACFSGDWAVLICCLGVLV